MDKSKYFANIIAGNNTPNLEQELINNFGLLCSITAINILLKNEDKLALFNQWKADITKTYEDQLKIHAEMMDGFAFATILSPKCDDLRKKYQESLAKVEVLIKQFINEK